MYVEAYETSIKPLNYAFVPNVCYRGLRFDSFSKASLDPHTAPLPGQIMGR